MTRRAPKDLAASVRRRLLDRARQRAEDYQLVLVHYGVERFLYRLSMSRHADRFILKGAMLFSAWEEAPHRPTRDLDLLGYGDDEVSSVEQVVADIVRTDVEPDGLEFDEGSIRGEEIREEQEYRGVRVRLTAHLAGARIPLQVDVAFGDDVVSPAPEPSSTRRCWTPPPRGCGPIPPSRWWPRSSRPWWHSGWPTAG